MKNSAIRTRWAAIGAAVAITLGAGGIGLVSATSPAGAVAYVPIEPCRIADTRPEPAFNVGPRSTPIGQNDTHTITGHGDNGECTGIPTSATGLQLNVTAVDASQNTFVTVWGDGVRPNASSLNPALGQPPAPNAVTTGLSATGTFNVYNRFGTVDVIADVVGYYTDHDHDDRYYTETEVDAALGQTKYINLPTIFDADGKMANAPFGSPFLDATVILPPDYTPGTDMTLRVNLLVADDPCTIQLRPNYSYVYRDGTGNLDDDGGSVSGALSPDPQPVDFPATAGRATRTVEFTVGAPGTIPLAPGDAMSLGLFFGAATTCADADIHAAMLYYS